MPIYLKKRISLALRALRYGETTKPGYGEIPPLTAEEVAEARAFFPMDKFFIFGHARSGTTMLARLARVHPEVHCNWQAHFFTREPLLESLVMDEAVHAWLKRGSNRWNRGEDLSPVVLRAVADFILERDARQAGKHIVGDKSPNSLNNGEAVRLMHRIYPDARLIFIVRDGRDAVISHRFQTFVEFRDRLSREDLQIRTDFARNAEPFLRGERSVFTETALRRAAQGWVCNVVETDQRGRELYGEQYLSLRFEDLLANPWQEMSRLWGFLGANSTLAQLDQALAAEMKQNPDAEWQQQKAKDIAQPLQRGRQGSWREMFTTRDQQLFMDIAGETLQAWGYAT